MDTREQLWQEAEETLAAFVREKRTEERIDARIQALIDEQANVATLGDSIG